MWLRGTCGEQKDRERNKNDSPNVMHGTPHLEAAAPVNPYQSHVDLRTPSIPFAEANIDFIVRMISADSRYQTAKGTRARQNYGLCSACDSDRAVVVCLDGGRAMETQNMNPSLEAVLRSIPDPRIGLSDDVLNFGFRVTPMSSHCLFSCHTMVQNYF